MYQRLLFFDRRTAVAPKRLTLTSAIAASIAMLGAPAVLAAEEDEQKVLEEVLTIGTRSQTGRTLLDSPVPADILTEEIIEATGATETGRAIQALAPSFNFSSSSISDGTDALRPATLRGLGPDQTLVLVNGKRRHNSALIHVNTSVGRGTAGVDMNAIAPGSIKRIEVLRDGAAAQYGSDAIAGVINLVLKDNHEGGSTSVSYGTTEEGDGETKVVNFSNGWGSSDAWINLATEWRDRGHTNRAGLDGSQQYLLEGDGSFDPREFTFDRNSFVIGDADSRQYALTLNSGWNITDDTELYAFATWSDRDNTSRGFYRRVTDVNRNPAGSAYPDGFLPHINTAIDDLSFNGGIRRNLGDGWNLDVGLGYSKNTFDFTISNSHNASAVLAFGSSDSSAFAGGVELGLFTFNADATKQLDWGLLAFGIEYKRDVYELTPGEELSWADYDGLDPDSGEGGIQVFPGFRPENSVDENRNAKALYLDVEWNVDEDLLLTGAIRFENYSDFDSTITGKGAFRWKATDQVTFRGAVSTGFRAPSMQQRFFNNVSTQFVFDPDTDEQVPIEVRTVRNDSSVVQALGVPSLEEEESINYSLGAVLQPHENLSITLDFYRIEIEDRIVISGRLAKNIDDDLDDLLEAAGADSAQFFLNAADTETEGVDLVVTWDVPLDMVDQNLRVSLAANHTNTKVTDVFVPTSLGSIPGIEDLIFTSQDKSILEEWQPKDRVNLTGNWQSGDFTTVLSFNYYGEYTVEDGPRQNFDGKTLADLQLNYDFSEQFTLTLGGNNIFDETPDENRVGQSRGSPDGGLVDPVTDEFIVDSPGVFVFSRRSAPFGFNGAYWYLRGTYKF
ncbi:TonB-dependent receptor [Porticoccaceae bacterium LTM1]|nr:TonB-dependent receptor [Porticoccaceae bacterium LTM1]